MASPESSPITFQLTDDHKVTFEGMLTASDAPVLIQLPGVRPKDVVTYALSGGGTFECREDGAIVIRPGEFGVEMNGLTIPVEDVPD